MRVSFPLFFTLLPGPLLATLVFASEPSVEGGAPFRHGGEDAGTMDSCDAEPHAGICAGKPTFKLTSESSLLDYLDPVLLEDDETLVDIRKSVRSGQLVVIRDAFIPEFAEHVWKQLNRDDLSWTSGCWRTPTSKHIRGQVTCTHMPDKRSYSSELLEVMDMLDNTKTKDFMETISGRKCSGPTWNMNPSWYKPGDYASPHTDFLQMRYTAFLWNLSKDWDPSWGGAFYWSPAGNVEDGFHYPTFNTLLLFLPTPSSVHMVTPVTENAKGKRLVLGGTFVAGGGKDALTVQTLLKTFTSTRKTTVDLRRMQLHG
jgi:Rps23 Pro-64 3,4-dihydroxylase Tpa1-like proline 4-hydroxylase